MSNVGKLGEGNFTLRLTVEDNTPGGTKDVKVELIDKSDFNGGKEYVMDSQIIKGDDNKTDFAKGEKTVILAGQEFKLDNLDENFVKAVQNPAGDKMKTLDVTLTNEVTKEEDGVKLQVGANQEQLIY